MNGAKLQSKVVPVMRFLKHLWTLWAVALALAALVIAAVVRWRRASLPSSLSHLKPGRRWEYDVSPDGGVEVIEVLDSWTLPDGRQAFRLEYRRGETTIDAVFSNDAGGNLIQLSQSRGTATFDPPLIGLGQLRVGALWSTTSWMVFPSMFRASSPTEVSGRVVSHGSVTVPAGTFAAYRIEQMVNGRSSTAWHAPGVGLIREIGDEEELVLRRLTDQPWDASRATPPDGPTASKFWTGD